MAGSGNVTQKVEIVGGLTSSNSFDTLYVPRLVFISLEFPVSPWLTHACSSFVSDRSTA